MLNSRRALVVVAALVAFPVIQARTQSPDVAGVTSPRAEFGADIGDDYFLATYTQMERYWKKLERESDRMTLADIGPTEEGRRQLMAIVTAPANLQQVDRYREISRRLALAEGVTEEEARALAQEGKAVVWIDGGLHANETLGAQQLIELVHQLVSRSDEETLRILRDVIVLAVHANPDGHELVANWYMREPNPLRRTTAGIPRLYQKYVGHDNNRDFYMSTQSETVNMNRILYREWLPQIVYNHHQSGPPGTVMFAPPFRDPFNYVFDPLIPVSIDFVGAAMHARFAAEGKPGVTMRRGGTYSTWWNGGLRTAAYFHNQIGLLTETIGHPTPSEIPFVAERQLPSSDLPYPISPQTWRFRQSVEYSLTANRAVLDLASRYREALLLNAYRMGRNGIDRGSRDHWTVSPARLSPPTRGRGTGPAAAAPGERLRDPALRDARGYILPADQPDFLTATKFVDALLKAGVTVHRATADFVVAGRTYPARSYVVKTAQAFRPYVLDMFEPQDHPHDVAYPGGPPVPPYDSAGWTLAFQMGVKFSRVLEGFDGPFERVTRASPPPGRVTGVDSPAGFLVSHHPNDAFVAVNRLLAAGEEVFWPRDRRIGSTAADTGAMYVAARPTTRRLIEQAAADLALTFTGVGAPPSGDAFKLRPARIGLWDKYGGSTPSGWTRWLLERFEFPFERVYAQTLDAGNLIRRYDVLIFPDDAVPAGERTGPDALPRERIPPEYHASLGAISWERTVPQLRRFVEEGGALVLMGESAVIAERLGLPLGSALVERQADGSIRPLPRDKYYVPGSIVRMTVDNTMPLGFGFEREVDVFFDNSPVFRARGETSPRVRRVAWFASAAPLRSGWALGQHHLEGGIAVAEAPLGNGRVFLFGPGVTFRAQSHGTFKFLFNAIHYGNAAPVRLDNGVGGSR